MVCLRNMCMATLNKGDNDYNNTELINIAEYLNSKYTEDQFVNIAKSHKSYQPEMNSTIKSHSKGCRRIKPIK